MIRPTYAWVFLLCVVSAIGLKVYAAEISNVQIQDIAQTSAKVIWKTDSDTDATINYGIDTNFGEVRDPSSSKDHAISIDGLIPATTYHFRVVSTDKDGNKSANAGFVFTTGGSVADKIVADLDKVVEPKDIEKIVKKVQKVAGDILKAPSIIGSPKVTPTTDGAVITWTTDRESNSMARMVPEDEWSADSKDPYTLTQGQPNESVTRHAVEVVGLKSATVYHFQVTSEDIAGLKGATTDDTFKTKSILPAVHNVKVSRVQEHAATINWDTGDVKAKGVVEYTNQRTHITKSAGNAIFSTKQSLTIANLEFGSRYTGSVIATNEGGENATSQQFSFITVRDVIPPVISQVKNESTLYPGEDSKVQTILSWETDEPASCQVSYSQGLVKTGADTASMPAELNPLTKHTQVVVGFAAGTVYKFWMKCHDAADNEAQSDDFVLITPVKEKNIIDIILQNFQGTFGWVNKIGK